MAKKTTTTNKKRVVKVDAYGEAHISSTFNNVIISLTNSVGQLVFRRKERFQRFKEEYSVCGSGGSSRCCKDCI